MKSRLFSSTNTMTTTSPVAKCFFVMYLQAYEEENGGHKCSSWRMRPVSKHIYISKLLKNIACTASTKSHEDETRCRFSLVDSPYRWVTSAFAKLGILSSTRTTTDRYPVQTTVNILATVQ